MFGRGAFFHKRFTGDRKGTMGERRLVDPFVPATDSQCIYRSALAVIFQHLHADVPQ